MRDAETVEITSPPRALERALSHTFRNYRRDAKEDGRQFALSQEAFCRILVSPCNYCGHYGDERWFFNLSGRTKKGRKKTKWKAVFNGVDRVDNSLGYEPGNVVPCCRACNYAKHKMSIAAFTEWMDRLVAYRQQPPTNFSLSNGASQILGGADAETLGTDQSGSGRSDE